MKSTTRPFRLVALSNSLGPGRTSYNADRKGIASPAAPAAAEPAGGCSAGAHSTHRWGLSGQLLREESPSEAAMQAQTGVSSGCGSSFACREVTPPPCRPAADVGLADAAAAAAAAAGGGAKGGKGGCSNMEDASPDASSTPLCWAVAQGVLGGGADAYCTGGSSSTTLLPRVQQQHAPAAAVPQGGLAVTVVRSKRERVSEPGDGGRHYPAAVSLPKQLALAAATEQQRLVRLGAGSTSTPEELLQVQRSDGSGSSSCGSGMFLLAGCSKGSSSDSPINLGVNGQLLLIAQHQQHRQEYYNLLALMEQQQHLQQFKAGAAKAVIAAHQSQQQLAHAVALSLAAQQQQNGRRKLSVLRSASSAAVMHPSLAAPLIAPTDAALAWAGGVLGVNRREVFLFAQHIWARASARVDELLVVSLGPSQPPTHVALLVALWMSSKLEGNRRQVSGASRLCAATGLTRWGITSIEVHLLQLLDFSPYRGW